MRSAPEPQSIREGDRRALAQAITLVESTRPEDREAAQRLLDALVPADDPVDVRKTARRVGITGVPGAGKSTFIDALGARLIERGHRVAVLAVDPSSARTGGSILGDKTRMATLSTDPRAFVRPSPGGATAGGVARRTREAGLLCEAAGFDVVLVETIGIGQSEVAVADLVDSFVLLHLARSGDDLQGIKRGVMEFVDVIAVHKADSGNEDATAEARGQLELALQLLQPATPDWRVPVRCASSTTGAGLDEVWTEIEAHRTHLVDSGRLLARRRAQALRWLDAAIREFIDDRIERDAEISACMEELREAVRAGRLQPTAAARRVVHRLFDR